MHRAIKVSLSLATETKGRRIATLLREVRACANRYVRHVWTHGGRLDAKTLKSVSGGSLSYRHRANCLKTALEIIGVTRKTARTSGRLAGRPFFRGAFMLANDVAKIERGKGAFDYVLKISGLVRYKRIIIPFQSHKRLNSWLAKPGAKLLNGCILGDGWAAVYVSIPTAKTKDGKTLGVDVGINKLLVDSDGKQYGRKIKALCAKVRRKKPGGKARRRAANERKDYINREVKKLPWSKLGTIGIENLKHLKTGKRPGRGKSFRKAIAPWTYRQALQRIGQLAEENRVRLVTVNPRGTSRTCPRCGMCASENRRGEGFSCISPNCNYSADADYVGALNVLARTLDNSGQPMVAQLPRVEAKT